MATESRPYGGLLRIDYGTAQTVNVHGTFQINEVSVTATPAEMNYNDITTLGTGAASKAVVLDAGEDYTWPATGVLTYGVLKDPAGTSLGATAAEINSKCQNSVRTQTIAAAGALSVTIPQSNLALVGAGAVTLAAPTDNGMIKVISMTTDNGDVTLALTNVVGGSAATTCTFNDVGDHLVLVSSVLAGKWIVLKEVGVAMS